MEEFISNCQWQPASPGSLSLLLPMSHVVGGPWVGFSGCVPVLSICCLPPSCSTTCISNPFLRQLWWAFTTSLQENKMQHLPVSVQLDGHTSSCWAFFRNIILGFCYKNKNKTPSLTSTQILSSTTTGISLHENNNFAFSFCLVGLWHQAKLFALSHVYI